MADNVTLPGTGVVVASDDIAGVQIQRIKLVQGADGVDDGNVGSGSPLHAQLTNLEKAEDAAHSSGDKGVMVLGVRQDADTSPVSADGDYHALILNEAGRLKVSTVAADLAATTGTITANGQTVSCDVTKASNVCLFVTGTFSTVNLTFEASIDGGTNWFAVQMVRSNANTVELTTGNLSAAPAYSWECSVNAYTHFRVRATAFASGTQNIRILPGVYATEPIIATQSTAVTGTVTANLGTGGTAATSLGKAEDAVAASGDTGVAVLAVRRDTPSSDVSAAGDYATLQVNATGSLWTARAVSTAGGATSGRIKAAASTNATNLKASAGQVYGYHLFNRAAYEVFVKLHNKASAPTVGTDVPAWTISIPPYGGVAVSFSTGVVFGTGIGYQIVKGVADTDATAVAADDVHGFIAYA